LKKSKKYTSSFNLKRLKTLCLSQVKSIIKRNCTPA